MAFPDLAEHLAETFGLSPGMHYVLAVECSARHALAKARSLEWSKTGPGRAKNRRTARKRRADPAKRAAENARRRVLRAVQRARARDAVADAITRRAPLGALIPPDGRSKAR